MKAMSSLERVASAIQLKEPDSVPVIPVMMIRALREAGLTATSETLSDAESMAQSKLRAFHKYGGDAVVAGTGLNVETEALGCRLEYLDDEIPVVAHRPLCGDPSLNQLGHLGLESGRVASVAKEVEILNSELGKQVVVGVCFSGPFTTALELRGLEQCVGDMEDHCDYFTKLMDRVTEETIRYTDILMDHGALALNMLEPLCSTDVISPSTYFAWAWPWHMKIMQHISGKGRVPIIHVCTHTEALWEGLADSGAMAFHGDMLPALESCKQRIGGRMCLIGNVNPVDVMLNGSPDDVREAAEDCIKRAAGGGGFVLAPGCDTGFDVPEDNLHALVEAARRATYPLG